MQEVLLNIFPVFLSFTTFIVNTFIQIAIYPSISVTLMAFTVDEKCLTYDNQGCSAENQRRTEPNYLKASTSFEFFLIFLSNYLKASTFFDFGGVGVSFRRFTAFALTRSVAHFHCESLVAYTFDKTSH